jgi:hypothetical protein
MEGKLFLYVFQNFLLAVETLLPLPKLIGIGECN